MAGTTVAKALDWWRPKPSRSDHDRHASDRQRPESPLRHELHSTDLSLLPKSSSQGQQVHSTLEPSPLHYHFIQQPEEMFSSRKFSYASVKEDVGEDIPQSFESSLSSADLEEIEWIAWPCSQWCRSKGLCSYQFGGTHEQYVQTRLEGYARSNPRKLEKILDQLEKRRQAQKLYNLPFASELTQFSLPTSDFRLDVWRERVKQATVAFNEVEESVFTDDEEEEVVPTTKPSKAPFETLPNEIADLILSHVQVDHTADPYARPHVDLASCSLTSKSIHAAAVRVMYRHVSIPRSRAFFKFTRSLEEDQTLGQFVHWLDFSHYSNMGFGRARSTTTRTPFLTPATLKACLDKLPLLQAFLVHEHVDDELDVNVISKLFSMPHMQALDFTACSSRSFAESFTKVCLTMPETTGVAHNIKRISLHECTTLPEVVFETLLPRLDQLTHLDVAHTMINDDALLSIPTTARITHLNLERCTRLTGPAVVKFLTTHPAVKNSIVYLNLMSDASRHRLLSETEVARVLKCLPNTIRSLNIGGARITSLHVPELQRLVSRLEELGLKGAELGMVADINRIFGIEEQADGEVTVANPTSLCYIDLTDVKSATQMSLSYSPTAITSALTQPLEVVEVGSSVLDELKRRNLRTKNPDWIVRELGRRGWYARQPQNQADEKPADDGSRAWKMGARWWGMRKIPVVDQDVGGMYGYFMFKRV